MSLADLPQVQAFSVEAKLELIDELWKSVSSDLASMEVTQEEKAALDRRWQEFLGDPSLAMTVDQFNKNLKKLRG